MSTKRLRIFLLVAPSVIGSLIWVLTMSGALHPSLRGWALSSNLLAWLPLPGTVGDILSLDYPRGSKTRRCLYLGGFGAALILGCHFMT
jgi:hypothetical protein